MMEGGEIHEKSVGGVEITLRDLHAALTDLLSKQGARMVVALMRKYNVARLADLPASRYADFMGDARNAYQAIVTEETREDTE